jgi:hypothetical protein
VATTEPSAFPIAFFTEAIVWWSVLVLTTYASFGASAVRVAGAACGAADAAAGRKPSEAVSDSTTGTARASRRLERK